MSDSAAAAGPITVRLNTAALKRRHVLRLAVFLVLGVLAAVSPWLFPDQSVLVNVISWIWSAGLILLGVAGLVGLPNIMGAHELVLSDRGLRHTLRGARLLEAEWSEFRELQLTHVVKPVNLHSPARSQVRLILRPHDPDGFYLRHEGLERNALMTDLAPDEHGIALLQRKEVIEPLDAALKATAGSRYLGVRTSSAKHLGLH